MTLKLPDCKCVLLIQSIVGLSMAEITKVTVLVL